MILAAFLRALGVRLGERAAVAVATLPGNEFLPGHAALAGKSGLRFVPRSRNPIGFANLENIMNSEYFIFPGGGLFQDYGFLSFWCYYSMVLAARCAGLKTVLLYQGFTGVRRPWAKAALGFLVRSVADHVSVRDERSLAFLGAPDGSGPKKFADASFILLDLFAAVSAEGPAPPSGGRSYTVGCSFRQWRGFGVREAVSLVRAVLSDPLASVSLYAMQAPADERFNASILSVLTPGEAERVRDAGRVNGIPAFAASLSNNLYNVGMRFHFCAASAMCSVPCVGVSYDPKVSELFRQMNLPELCVRAVFPDGAQGFAAAAAAAVRRRDEIARRLAAFSSSSSRTAWELFDEFLDRAGIVP